MTDRPPWIRIETSTHPYEQDLTLVVEADADWQEWSAEGESGGYVKFTINLSEELAAQIPCIQRVPAP